MTRTSPLKLEQPTTFGQGARVDRFPIAPGLDGAVFEYRRTEGRRRGSVSECVEIGVQLTGERTQAGYSSGARVSGSGSIHTLGHAEPYDVIYSASDQPGVVLYFLFDESSLGLTEADRELRFDDGCPRFTRALYALARDVYAARISDQALDGAEVVGALGAVVRSNASESQADPLVCARKEIEKHYHSGLYLRHFAERIDMHSTVFLRRFAQRYGITPVQYRTRVRLNTADRLALHDPDLTIASIASTCGFESTSYFHRAYMEYFGASVSARRARVCSDEGVR